MTYAWIATGLFHELEAVGPMSLANKHVQLPPDVSASFREVAKRNRTGEVLGADVFPEVMYANKYDLKPEKDFLPVMYGGFPMVNGRVASVLRDYDLGQSNLYPVKLANFDGSKTYDEYDYFILNVGNLKKAILPDQSRAIARSKWGTLQFYAQEDDQVALGPTAASGPDIWRDPDLEFVGAIFFSGRLGDALREAGFDNKALPMLRARVLSDGGSSNV